MEFPVPDRMAPFCLRLRLLGATCPLDLVSLGFVTWAGMGRRWVLRLPPLWTLTENTVLQMKDSLINLQNGIRSRDYTSESDEKRNRYH